MNTAGPRTPVYQGRFSPWTFAIMDRMMGTLYLIQCQHLYKLGFTRRGASKRIMGMATDNPFPITLIHEWPGSVADEWLWHQIFSSRHVRGEWFNLTEADVALVTEAS